MKNLTIAVLLSLLFYACTLDEEPEIVPVEYSSLKMQPEQDSLFLRANAESRQVSLIGAIINTTEKTLRNTGVMVDLNYTIRTIDTVFQGVDVAGAEWITTNSDVASVSKGLITARNPGYAQIYARVGNTTSNFLVVNVRAVDTAPGLSLDPPETILIFEDHTTISGYVQQGAILRVIEPDSGLDTNNVIYTTAGTFIVPVIGLNQGIRLITARATNPNNAALFTERQKTVIYYQPYTIEADKIVGNWLGTTLGKNFNFRITHSPIPLRYDIEGKLDIQFEGVGLVRDIDLIGFLNPNGTISATLSKSTNGFSISGKFDGYFKTTGTGEGSYSAKAEKSGWPKISFKEKWTAVKLP
ncbi:MAG: hypothetical protein WCW35_06960 [Bacteroidota bacterium]